MCAASDIVVKDELCIGSLASVIDQGRRPTHVVPVNAPSALLRHLHERRFPELVKSQHRFVRHAMQMPKQEKRAPFHVLSGKQAESHPWHLVDAKAARQQVAIAMHPKLEP